MSPTNGTSAPTAEQSASQHAFESLADSKENADVIKYAGPRALKVYYLPFKTFHDTATFPTAFAMLPRLRRIMIDEGVEIVHAHQSPSCMAHEAMFH